MKAKIIVSLIVRVSLVGCKKKTVDLQAALNWENMQQKPVPPPPMAATWPEEQAQRKAALENYINENWTAYTWFMQFPFGEKDGTPYILLKLLPELAPEIWGEGDNPLELAGLFMDERLPGYPVPRGIGWTGMTREDPGGAVDHASFSCSAGHVGRVRLDDGSIQYLDGGVNTHMNLSAYRVAIQKTIEKLTGGADNDLEELLNATKAVREGLDRVHAENPNFFYNNVVVDGRHYDTAYEAKQVELFESGLESELLLTDFLIRNDINYKALEALINTNYKGFESEMYKGFGGMVDATGTIMSWSYATEKEVTDLLHLKGKTLGESLPPTPGITDFMFVWEQDKRKVSWNEDRTELIDGGGQWNGNIPITMFRNMAAQLTLGLGPDTDFRIGAFGVVLLEGLPAPAYPFDVDLVLAEKGKVLYDQHCGGCHRPHNGGVYDIGTDSSRAYVVGGQSNVEGAREFFTSMMPPTRNLIIPPPDSNNVPPGAYSLKIAPGAIYDDESLVDKKQFAMRDAKDQHGYNALPLGGIWAQAPYLHNGSVPTIYHLLVPSERPTAFLKSSLDYDKEHLGFSWRLDEPIQDSAAYVFDSRAFHAFSNAGHDKDIQDGDNTYKLDWSDDEDGVMAIIEYMKTL